MLNCSGDASKWCKNIEKGDLDHLILLQSWTRPLFDWLLKVCTKECLSPFVGLLFVILAVGWLNWQVYLSQNWVCSWVYELKIATPKKRIIWNTYLMGQSCGSFSSLFKCYESLCLLQERNVGLDLWKNKKWLLKNQPQEVTSFLSPVQSLLETVL
jgi:hypothetical protein